MSAFSCLNILKSNAKVLAREQNIKRAVALDIIAKRSNFAHFHELSKIAASDPFDARLVAAALGVTNLGDAIYQDEAYAAFEYEIETLLGAAVSETNASNFSISGLVIEGATYDETIGKLALEVSLTYSGEQDQNRAYHGSAFFLKGVVQLLRRDGEWLLADDGVVITGADTDVDRDYRDQMDDWDAYNVPREPFPNALSRELGVTVGEAEQLVDGPITTNESEDGLIYNLWIDLEPVAAGPLREKLLRKFRSLQVELSANFFDGVEKRFD